MILRLYILGVLLLGVVLGIASIKSNKELRARSLTLLALLSVFCLIMWAGSLYFTLLIMVILLASVYELGTQYDLPLLPILAVAGGLFVILVSIPQILFYVFPVFVALSVSVFTLQADFVRRKGFFVLFTDAVLFGITIQCVYKCSNWADCWMQGSVQSL